MSKDRSMFMAMRSVGWLVLLAATVILGLNGGVRQTFGLFLEPMTQALQVSHGTFSLAIAVQNLLWGAFMPACGALADRYGTGRVLAIGGLIHTLGVLIMATVHTPFGLHAGAGVLIGLGVSATGYPMVLAAVARAAPEEKRSAWLGIAAAGGSLGQFLLLPAAQGMITTIGWMEALLAMAAASAVMVPLAAVLAGKAHTGASALGEQSLRDALHEASRHSGFLLLTAGFFVCGFHVAFVATHLPAYMSTTGLPAYVGAAALSVIAGVNILGTYAAGWLGGRYRQKRVLTMIYLGRVLAIAALLVAPKTEWAAYAFAAAFGLLWLGTVPLTGGLVGQIFGPRYMATLFGIVMFSHQIGAFFGAWLGGISFDLTGSYDAVWLIAMLLGVMAAALHWPIADAPVSRLSPQAERA